MKKNRTKVKKTQIRKAKDKKLGYDPNKVYPKIFVGFKPLSFEKPPLKEAKDKWGRWVRMLSEEAQNHKNQIVVSALQKGPKTLEELRTAIGSKHIFNVLEALTKKYGMTFEKIKNPGQPVRYKIGSMGSWSSGVSVVQPHEIKKVDAVGAAASFVASGGASVSGDGAGIPDDAKEFLDSIPDKTHPEEFSKDEKNAGDALIKYYPYKANSHTTEGYVEGWFKAEYPGVSFEKTLEYIKSKGFTVHKIPFDAKNYYTFENETTAKNNGDEAQQAVDEIINKLKSGHLYNDTKSIYGIENDYPKHHIEIINKLKKHPEVTFDASIGLLGGFKLKGEKTKDNPLEIAKKYAEQLTSGSAKKIFFDDIKKAYPNDQLYLKIGYVLNEMPNLILNGLPSMYWELKEKEKEDSKEIANAIASGLNLNAVDKVYAQEINSAHGEKGLTIGDHLDKNPTLEKKYDEALGFHWVKKAAVDPYIDLKAKQVLQILKDKKKISSIAMSKLGMGTKTQQKVIDHLKLGHVLYKKYSKVPGKDVWAYVGEKKSSTPPTPKGPVVNPTPTPTAAQIENQKKLQKAKSLFPTVGTVLTHDQLKDGMDGQEPELTIHHLGYNGYQLEINKTDPEKKTYKLLSINPTGGYTEHKTFIDHSKFIESLPHWKQHFYPEVAAHNHDIAENMKYYDKHAKSYYNEEHRKKLLAALEHCTIGVGKVKVANEELKALVHYTGSGYSSLNEALYEGMAVPDAEGYINEMDKHVSNGIKKVKSTSEEISVFSGLKVKDPRELIGEDGIFNVPAYMSTSLKLDKAEDFASSVPGILSNHSVKHILKISIPKGSKLAYVQNISNYKSEEECIIHKNAKIKLKEPKIVFSSAWSTKLLWEAELVHDGIS